ncbi:anthranilate phosphoribosyltransferase [Lacihabitans sp. CCS-44]|uniref:anthranilate phosphoribosyltransferase n=1 Tax=Lacihabitans sp. CCS-44 TaxID=2487331 RepID=UPI0020CDD4DB|nr:anthranilate phosphoribosyltransferase [Lacihabitans sp. CCS-44]MCP9755638.1 anthranilate phosphoribosyltransferase [Lacihabitans sp. CCS-44]
MKNLLKNLISSTDLSLEESRQAILKIGSGEINPAQIAAFLMAIQQKGITVDELKGFREGMLELAIGIDLTEFDAMDVCGTGGDGKDTFNISTTSAFVVAGAGQNVAKHGNHGVSSPVGSSTVLEHLGVQFTNDADFLRSKLEKAGICYLHAPLFHPAMRFVGPIRKELGIKTFFNILGPLMNPAKVQKQLSGVFDQKTFELYKDLFLTTGTKFGVLHALDGYDEVSLTGDFRLANNQSDKVLEPNNFGFANINAQELSGGNTLEESGKIMTDILKNQGTKAQTDTVIINAAIALSVARDIKIEEGIAQAKESLESGNALRCLELLVA